MNHLSIPILEFVTAQPAHKLPVVFTVEKYPLPDCSESPEEVFKEVLMLQKQGWIEAHVIRDVTGKPYRAEIHYITLEGRVFLDARQTKISENTPTAKLILWGGIGILILLTIILAGHIKGLRPQQQSLIPIKETPAATPVPTPTPVATPVPLAAPEASPSPATLATPTPVQLATPAPTPSSKSGEAVSKQRSFKKTW